MRYGRKVDLFSKPGTGAKHLQPPVKRTLQVLMASALPFLCDEPQGHFQTLQGGRYFPLGSCSRPWGLCIQKEQNYTDSARSQAVQVLKGCTPQPDDRLLGVRTGRRVELLFQQRERRRDPEQLNAWARGSDVLSDSSVSGRRKKCTLWRTAEINFNRTCSEHSRPKKPTCLLFGLFCPQFSAFCLLGEGGLRKAEQTLVVNIPRLPGRPHTGLFKPLGILAYHRHSAGAAQAPKDPLEAAVSMAR